LLDPESDLYWKVSEYLDEDEDEDDGDDKWFVSEKKLDLMQKEIGSVFDGKSRDELLNILVIIVRDFPEVASWLHEREQMATGKIERMVQSLRKEIRDLSITDVWSPDWEDGYDCADYDDVRVRLKALLDSGYADAVFELGQELWEEAQEQVANSNDDGELAESISDCMKIVLQALPDTRLTRSEQLSWLFNFLREDEYELLDGTDTVIDDARYTTAAWHDLALDLEKQLQELPITDKDEWRRQYRRSKIVAQLREAYERAKESAKVLPLLEREAEPCLCYETLAEYLIKAGDFVRARFWCIEGYGKLIEDAPGLASSLKGLLLELAEKEGKHDLVAAYRAQNYFEYPSVETYTRLRDSAEKIALWPKVCESAMAFLRSGMVPVFSELPVPEVNRPQKPEQNRFKLFPHLTLLIEIAILEQRRYDVISLFNELCDSGLCDRGISEKVAEAVATSHPDTSLKIWRSTVDNLIAEVKPHAYQEAAGYLLKMRKVWQETDRLAEWTALIAELRTRHKPKRRLMEVLSKVEKG